MKTRTATAPKLEINHDLRTSAMLALDETVAWLAERVPDRVPPGADLLLIAHPSWASGAAAEFSRRIRAELRNEPLFKRTLEAVLDELPKTLLVYNPDHNRLSSLRLQIDNGIDALRNPRKPEQLPAKWHSVAAAFGIELPQARHYTEDAGVRDQALETLLGAFRIHDPRLGPIVGDVRREALAEAAPSLACRRACAALVAIEALPAYFTEGDFAASDDELRTRTIAASIERPVATSGAPTPDANSQWYRHVYLGLTMPTIPHWYGALSGGLVTQLGETMPTMATTNWTQKIRAEIEPLIAKMYGPGRGLAFVDVKENPRATRYDDDFAFREAVHSVMRSGAAITEARKVADAWWFDVVEQYERILKSFDATLEKMKIGPAWWFVRELREHVARLPSDVPEWLITAPARFGVKIEVRR